MEYHISAPLSLCGTSHINISNNRYIQDSRNRTITFQASDAEYGNLNAYICSNAYINLLDNLMTVVYFSLIYPIYYFSKYITIQVNRIYRIYLN